MKSGVMSEREHAIICLILAKLSIFIDTLMKLRLDK